jgi:hypothetical protein
MSLLTLSGVAHAVRAAAGKILSGSPARGDSGSLRDSLRVAHAAPRKKKPADAFTGDRGFLVSVRLLTY